MQKLYDAKKIRLSYGILSSNVWKYTDLMKSLFRDSCADVFTEKAVLQNFAKVTDKRTPVLQSLFNKPEGQQLYEQVTPAQVLFLRIL